MQSNGGGGGLDLHFTHGVSCCWVEIRTKTFVDLSGRDESGNLAIESKEEINPSPTIIEELLQDTRTLSILLIILKLVMLKHPALFFW